MAILLFVDTPFSSRGVHPFVPGTPIDVSPAQSTAMAAVDGSTANLAFSGTTNAGVIEWRMSAGATLSVPTGQVLTSLTVEVVARVAAPVSYTTDAIWGIELYDSRTSATLGALSKQATIPISSSLVSCQAGTGGLWGLTQAQLLDVLSAGALRVRWTSPGWTTGSTGSLIIDGARLTVESGLAPASKRQTILTRRTATPGKVPAPSDIEIGELALNLADGRLFAGDATAPINLTQITPYRDQAAYLAGAITLYQGRLWVANSNTGPGARNGAAWNEYHAFSSEWANHLNGMTLNNVYDIIYPFEVPRLWRGDQASLITQNNNLASWGINARWWFADGFDGRPDALDRVVRGAQIDSQVNTTGGAWSYNTDFQGSHAHGNVTGDHTLTIAEIPSHNHNPDGNFTQLLRNNNAQNSVNDSAIGNFAGINLRASGFITAQGGGQAHNHGIGLDGSHQHAVSVEVKYIRWWWLVRTV